MNNPFIDKDPYMTEDEELGSLSALYAPEPEARARPASRRRRILQVSPDLLAPPQPEDDWSMTFLNDIGNKARLLAEDIETYLNQKGYAGDMLRRCRLRVKYLELEEALAQFRLGRMLNVRRIDGTEDEAETSGVV